jgi:hypothetical protein
MAMSMWQRSGCRVERLTPGYTGAHLICASLEELHQRLRSMRVKSNLTEAPLKDSSRTIRVFWSYGGNKHLGDYELG